MDLVEYNKKNAGQNFSRHPWELARLKVVDDLLKNTLRNEKNYTVADIGCGDTFFVESLAAMYPEVTFYAIDTAFTDELMNDYKTRLTGKKIFLYKTMEEASKDMKKPADLVLLLDVIEHIPDDRAFLKELSKSTITDINTVITITVPAYQSLFCSHDVFLKHFRRYDNTLLIAAIESAGFEKIRAGYFFSSLIPPRILQVIKEKAFKAKAQDATSGLVEWKGSVTASRLVSGILYTDYLITSVVQKISGIKIPGLSNYILCRKPA